MKDLVTLKKPTEVRGSRKKLSSFAREPAFDRESHRSPENLSQLPSPKQDSAVSQTLSQRGVSIQSPLVACRSERDVSWKGLESGLFEVWVERERRGKVELFHENE